MAVLSVLGRANMWRASVNFQKVIGQHSCIKVPVRNMASGHQKIMNITPSRFQYSRFKDDFHFYAMLGIIPLSIIIFCANVFVGPAQLAEIPEGYEPKRWEYYKSPIKRFFARYFQTSEQEEYEKIMHHLKEEMDRLQWKKDTQKVKMLMAERNDYKGPYFIPTDYGRHVRMARKQSDDLDERMGFK